MIAKEALIFAQKAHGDQTYDGFNYAYHLIQVVNIAKELGYSEEILVACALHDVLEDTKVTYTELKEKFGEEVAEIVYAVTDELGRNRRERKKKTYPKIRSNWKATVVKICDRIANIEYSKKSNPSMLKMYREEHESFISAIAVNETMGSTFKAWNRLGEAME